MTATVRDVAQAIETFAPLELQESYDNSGLVVGSPEMPVSGVLLAVDVTEEVIEEAKSVGANLIVTHHPIIFHALKRLNSQNYVARCVEEAIRSCIALYACHTNLDSAPHGMSWNLGDILSLKDMQVLEPHSAKELGAGFGVVGNLDDEQSLDDFMAFVADRLSLSTMRHSKPINRRVSKVAICTGAGASLIELVREAKADVYITADLKYNDFMEPAESFTVLDIGHFESEYCAIELLNSILSKKMFNFAVRKSDYSCNPVYYQWFK